MAQDTFDTLQTSFQFVFTDEKETNNIKLRYEVNFFTNYEKNEVNDT